jgi:PAS domain S-box-containing protein
VKGGTGLGVDYCAVCDAAVGEGAAEAHVAAAGIRDVLAGTRDEFEQDYPCHSPTQERWYHMTARRVVRTGAVAVVVTHTEITAEHTRARSDARYQRFVETTHEGVLAMDREGRITYANRRAGDLLRCESSALLGRTCFDFMPPDAAFAARTQFLRLWRGISNDMETQMVRCDNAIIDVVLAESPILADDGTFTGVLAMISDVTERRRIEREQAETRFRIVQDASPDSFILLEVIPDAAGGMQDARIVYANDAACELMDRPIGSLAGRLLDEAFPGARSSGRYELYAEVYRTGVRRELVFYHENAQKWLRVVIVKVDNGFCLISADISGQKAAEVVLRRSNAELEQRVSERTAELETARDAAEAASRAKSDFLSRASHELRTPLNAVIGFSGVMLKNRGGHLRVTDLVHADRINRNGRHLLSLVNELLDLSRIEAGRVDLELTSVSLRELVGEVRETLGGSAAEAGLILTVEGPHGQEGAEMRIVTDVQRLRQVLLNLVGNAIKYTERGAVTIRIMSNVAGLPSRIDVVDTGMGIPADRMEDMFEPFVVGEMLPSGGESTGLGLTIARSLCALLGYRLFATSAVGQGSTFSVEVRSDAA